MKRAILKIPEGLELSQLTPEQQAAIASVFAEFVMPMPGTVIANESKIVDAITADNFDPEVMYALDLPFGLMGLWSWDGISDELIELDELEEDFIDFLPEGAELAIPHGFAGWPSC